MHSNDERAIDETEQRLYEFDACRETRFYSERAALAWIEAVTIVSDAHVRDSAFEKERKHFSDNEIVDLNFVAAVINFWIRLAIAVRAVPGHYREATATASVG